MNDEKSFDKLENKINGLLDKFSESISKLVRSCENKEDRVKAIKNANPSNSILVKLYETAKKNEDFETCDAVIELLIERGIKISN